MIVVSVMLMSAVDGRAQELARMEICNMGTGTRTLGNYSAETLRGRSTEDFARRTRQRIAYVNGHAREREHVWNLVAKSLASLRYGDPPSDEARIDRAAQAIAQMVNQIEFGKTINNWTEGKEEDRAFFRALAVAALGVDETQ